MEKGKVIKGIYKLNDKLEILVDQESKLYIEARKNNEKAIKVTRNEKEVEITEGVLWEEIRMTGLKGDAFDVLNKMYPKVFEIAIKREEQNAELQKFIQTEFGFDFQQMTIANYLKLTEAVIDYKLTESKGGKVREIFKKK